MLRALPNAAHVLPPLPTATPTLTGSYAVPAMTTPAAVGRMLELRQVTNTYTDTDLYGSYSDCDAYLFASSCDSAYVSCIESVDSDFYDDYTATTYNTQGMYSSITSCYCNYGVAYLSCYFSAMEQQTCISYYGLTGNYESYWFQQYCGTVPATLKSAKAATTATKPPTSVSLDFEPVTIVTLNSTLPAPTYTYAPIYNGSGSLLADDCGKTQFTLIEDASTVVWVPFVGCAKDKPHCCPFTASSEFFAATVTADTTVTMTAVITATATSSSNVLMDGAYPQAAVAGQNTLMHCAADYYSISGNCCPSGYWPFTRDLGGQTPCYSSLGATTKAPTLTAGLVGEPTATQKPTSAVVNIVWAMSYPVASKKGLSTGATAGIAVGTVVAIAAIGTLSFCLWRMRKKNRKLQEQTAQQQQQQQQAPPIQQPGIQEMSAHGMVPKDQQAMVQVQGADGNMYLYPQNTGVGQHGSLAPTSVGTPGTVVSELSGGVSSTGSGATLLAGAGATPVHNVAGYPPPIAEVGGNYPLQQQQAYYPPPQQPEQAGYYAQGQPPVQYASDGEPPRQDYPYQQQYQQPQQLQAEIAPVEAAASPVSQSSVPVGQPLQAPVDYQQQQPYPPQVQQVSQGHPQIHHQDTASPIQYANPQQLPPQQQSQPSQQSQQPHAQ